MSETRVACCAILAVVLLRPGSCLRAAEAADPAVLLEQGRYERLREVLSAQERRQRRSEGRPYWFPTSVVDFQAALRGPRTGSGALLQECADLLLKTKRIALAEKAYRKALAAESGPRTLVELRHGLAAAQFVENGGEDLASYRRSLDTFKQAAEAEVGDRDLKALSELGVCYGEWHVWVYGGRPEGGASRAVAACSRALKRKPRDEIAAEISEVLASVYLDGGDRKSGGVYLEQALALLEKIEGRSKAERGGALSGEIARLKDRLKRTRR